MNQAEVEQFVANLDNVQREENYGYTFFYFGDDHRMGFVTIANSDNEYDSVSNLNREGVFRVNIGVSRMTFTLFLAHFSSVNIDYSALNVFMPHPDYAKQHFLCILNPSGENCEETKKFIVEAHALAAARYQRKTNSSSNQ